MATSASTKVTWVVGGLLALAASVAFVAVILDPFGAEQPEPVPALWEVEPTAQLDPTTSAVPILVRETSCAGVSARDRIEVTIEYRPLEVEFDVGVRQLPGFQPCPSNPTTPYTVQLDEPLGGRSIVGERPIVGL